MTLKKDNFSPYLFHQGTNYHAYEYMGIHKCGNKYSVRVWAPNAVAVYLTGDFNSWGDTVPLEKITEGGIWEAYITSKIFGEGCIYKFKVIGAKGEVLYKADPYARYAQRPPETASIYYDTNGYEWHDSSWLEYRSKKMTESERMKQPMNIYEIHFGSWKLKEDGSHLSYSEMADELVPYIKQMGYTHVELMPIMEHPFDGSWGYQVCGYYAPTSRFGTPKEFMGFVDTMHKAGIGVILDWVPAHFPKDAHGLYEFDGQPLYEYQGADRMEHKGWGTRRFDVGRNEVECFLISNAIYWLKEYHVDGLRVDAVASMLYLDYDKKQGEWIPNVYGDNRCLEAIAFFQKLNSSIYNEFPDTLVIAEESSAWSHVTGFANDGLGFSMKWNMGWMNDSLSYVEKDPVYRKYHHNNLTFPLVYAYNERYVLPISHDEVVHGKKSLLDKMPGIYEEKFAGERAFLGYMMTIPGKKLMFMGAEIGQFREWDFQGQIEWFLLKYEKHSQMQRYVSELNHFYLENRPLWENDTDWEGFSWIDANNADMSVISFKRTDRSGKELFVTINFTPVTRTDFVLDIKEKGAYTEVFNSDDIKYGGRGIVNHGNIKSVNDPDDDRKHLIRFNLPPLSIVIFKKNKTR